MAVAVAEAQTVAVAVAVAAAYLASLTGKLFIRLTLVVTACTETLCPFQLVGQLGMRQLQC